MKQDNRSLLSLIKKRKLNLSEKHQQMLYTALNINFLADPFTEYDIIVRLWALGLMKEGFLVFEKGLVDIKKYAMLLSS
jgi:hypothetical protein